MAKRKSVSTKRSVTQYEHRDKKRVNNPPVGLVNPDTDKDGQATTYQYDPHIDPQLQWAGKAEHTSFEVPTVSLHVHERIDPRTIIDAVRKKNGQPEDQMSLFGEPEENPPLRSALEFYQHSNHWKNRLIAGDSLLVMNSMLEKEGMAGKVQTVYFDPPYGIKYGSNFQPFVNKRDVKDGKDEDLTQEPEMIRAFRDTWELGIHSYLTYMRDRLLLARELLSESGSVFVQISDENVHHVRELMDEVFGVENAMPTIVFRKTTGAGSPTGYVSAVPQTFDYLLWYSKSRNSAKFQRLFLPRNIAEDSNYRWVEESGGLRRRLAGNESINDLPQSSRVFRPNPLTSQSGGPTTQFEVDFDGKKFRPSKGGWKTNFEGMQQLREANRLMVIGQTLCFLRYADDFPYAPVIDIWDDTRQSGFGTAKAYVVQTAPRVIQRCILMTTDPGDLVLDITCGSGTTAVVAEEWGRRWITCDTSRVAITLAKQRLMTSSFDYYHLARPEEGIGSGFKYKTVPHITLKSIANNEPAPEETLYDQPYIDNAKTRVTGPFTVEAVPAPTVRAIHEVDPEGLQQGNGKPTDEQQKADTSIARSGETLRQSEWRDELLRTGIRGKGGSKMEFARIEPLSGTRWLHAEGETKPTDSLPAQRVVVSFGPEYALLEQRQVELAMKEAWRLVPKPTVVIFAAFEFDSEAAKDIEETKAGDIQLLMAKMNADLLTEDLKKKRTSNESFWLIGQPDVQIQKIEKGDDKGRFRVVVNGFDYYDVKTGKIVSGTASNIAMWMLDTDYDGRSVFPRQVFFPMSGAKEGWAKLAKSLKAEVDEDLLDAYQGTESLPFSPGANKRVAVKIVDDRGIESLKIVEVK